MLATDIRDLLRKCVKQGFSLDSISMATRLTVEELQRMLDDSYYLPDDYSRVSYLGIFLMLLYAVTPADHFYFTSLLDTLTTYFGISKEAIANYLGISIDELNSFDNSPRKSYIELKLMHLFTTFIRDARFSQLNPDQQEAM
jgi:hypothetical protein